MKVCIYCREVRARVWTGKGWAHRRCVDEVEATRKAERPRERTAPAESNRTGCPESNHKIDETSAL